MIETSLSEVSKTELRNMANREVLQISTNKLSSLKDTASLLLGNRFLLSIFCTLKSLELVFLNSHPQLGL